MSEGRGTKFYRGLVQVVFILCYVAFMWASIHKVAYFFSNFEASGGNQIGAYALAGAFDVTALVTTMAVMFSRKNMPLYVQVIVWLFILTIAGFSYFVNWEYDAHFQNVNFVIQATGKFIPVYDTKGVLHQVPEMVTNKVLLSLNPILASGFTIFSLIYSVVAEFFGTKPPTIAELEARKKYLEETEEIEENIKQLEGKRKAKGLLQRAKETVKEGKEVWKELRKPEETEEENMSNPERNTDELEALTSEETEQESAAQLEETEEESQRKRNRKAKENAEESPEEFTEENLPSWLSASGSTIPLLTVVDNTKIPMKTLRNRVGKREIRATKNKDIVYKSSLVEWMKAEGYLQETAKIVHLNAVRNEEERETVAVQ